MSISELTQLDSGKSMIRYFTAERNRRLSQLLGQRVEARTLAASQDHCDHFFCHNCSPLKLVYLHGPHRLRVAAGTAHHTRRLRFRYRCFGLGCFLPFWAFSSRFCCHGFGCALFWGGSFGGRRLGCLFRVWRFGSFCLGGLFLLFAGSGNAEIDGGQRRQGYLKYAGQSRASGP